MLAKSRSNYDLRRFSVDPLKAQGQSRNGVKKTGLRIRRNILEEKVEKTILPRFYTV